MFSAVCRSLLRAQLLPCEGFKPCRQREVIPVPEKEEQQQPMALVQDPPLEPNKKEVFPTIAGTSAPQRHKNNESPPPDIVFHDQYFAPGLDLDLVKESLDRKRGSYEGKAKRAFQCTAGLPDFW